MNLRSLLQSLRLARRAKPQERISPEQLREALTATLADPQTRKLLLQDLIGKAFPIEGGACTPAGDIQAGTVFGINCAGYPGNYDFPRTLRALSATASAPTSGKGVEMYYDSGGNVGVLASIDRSTGGFQGIIYGALAHLFFNSGVEVARLHPSGKLGIGTATPVRKLHVVGAAGENFQARLEAPAGAVSLEFYQGATPLGLIASGATSFDLYNGNIAGGPRVSIAQATGNVAIRSLNKIITLRPLGGTQDDAPQINNAITALPSSGGIIMLEPSPMQEEPFRIGSTILIEKNGVKLRGYGAATSIFGDNPVPLTKLLWTGSAQTMVSAKYPSASPGVNVHDLEISDLVIDGASVAQRGLLLDQVINSKFVNMHVINMATIGGVGIELNCTGDNNTAWNLFENCWVFDASKGVVLGADSAAAVNSAHNTFIGLSVQYRANAADSCGIWLKECDNNTFYRTYIHVAANPIAGFGVIAESPRDAAANYFYHLQADRGLRVKNTNLPDPGLNKIFVFGYDQANSQPDPSSEPDPVTTKYVFWIDSKGHIRGQEP